MDAPNQDLDERKSALDSILSGYGSVLVAFSGGVDSTLLAAVAHEVLGARALAVTAVSPSLARRERDAAASLALPFFPAMTESQVARVAAALAGVIAA